MLSKEQIEQSLKDGTSYEKIIDSAQTPSDFKVLKEWLDTNPNPAAQEYLKKVVTDELFKIIYPPYGKTPDLERITQLIQLGVADINATVDDGTTLLMKATYSRTITKELLAIPGIDVNKRNKYGYTALMHAASVPLEESRTKRREIANILKEHGATFTENDLNEVKKMPKYFRILTDVFEPNPNPADGKAKTVDDKAKGADKTPIDRDGMS